MTTDTMTLTARIAEAEQAEAEPRNRIQQIQAQLNAALAAADYGTAERLQGELVLHEEVAAVRLAGHVGAGDTEAARRFVHEMEHGLGPWVVDPWRLIEHMAELVFRRQARQAGSPEHGTAAAGE